MAIRFLTPQSTADIAQIVREMAHANLRDPLRQVKSWPEYLFRRLKSVLSDFKAPFALVTLYNDDGDAQLQARSCATRRDVDDMAVSLIAVPSRIGPAKFRLVTAFMVENLSSAHEERPSGAASDDCQLSQVIAALNDIEQLLVFCRNDHQILESIDAVATAIRRSCDNASRYGILGARCSTSNPESSVEFAMLSARDDEERDSMLRELTRNTYRAWAFEAKLLVSGTSVNA